MPRGAERPRPAGDTSREETPPDIIKITGIKTYKFSIPAGQPTRDPHTGHLLGSTSKACLFLKIETDAGISGWGEGTGEWLVPSVEATLHEWSSLLVGQDPQRVVALSEDITDRLPWKGGPVLGTAIAAINVALYVNRPLAVVLSVIPPVPRVRPQHPLLAPHAPGLSAENGL